MIKKNMLHNMLSFIMWLLDGKTKTENNKNYNKTKTAKL